MVARSTFSQEQTMIESNTDHEPRVVELTDDLLETATGGLSLNFTKVSFKYTAADAAPTEPC